MLSIKLMNVLAIRLSQATYTGMDFFLWMPVIDMLEYWLLMMEMKEAEEGGE